MLARLFCFSRRSRSPQPASCPRNRASKSCSSPGRAIGYHNWEVSSPIVKRLLEDSGRFAVTVATTPPKGAAPNQDMSSFAPKFSDYQAVVLDYEGFEFAPPVKQAFVDYVKNGGGLVVLHAADNAFPGWAEYNEMIGVGGWGGFTPGYASRTQAAGPKIRWRDGGLVLDNDTPGNAQHPSPHDFLMTVRAPEHPIMKGLPPAWIHANDELYSNLRGPAKERDDSRDRDGADVDAERHRRERAHVMAIAYGKGRVFHDTLGHVGATQKEPIVPMNSVDYIVLLQRGTEWAATGAVTIPVPRDFPGRRQDVDQVSRTTVLRATGRCLPTGVAPAPARDPRSSVWPTRPTRPRAS
jgi:type 1 glutamine amidotransferase